MQVPRHIAIFGFHFCKTIFFGICILGIIRYIDVGFKEPESLLAAGSTALAALLSIAGILFFGRKADQHKSAEIRSAPPAPPLSGKKRKK